MKTRRQIFGQHFLRDKKIIEKIIFSIEEHIAAISEQPKMILEVGPGKLALTEPLSGLAVKLNMPLILVEKDEELKSYIESHTAHSLHFMDAASPRFCEFIDSLNEKKLAPIYFASNLPYSAGTQIIANLCQKIEFFNGATVMVQKDVAERMVALTDNGDHKHRGAFSYLIESHFDSKILFDVPATAFSPPPKVVSSIVRLTPKVKQKFADAVSSEKFEKFCKKIFGQRRKMIRQLFNEKQLEALKSRSLTGEERPENLDFDQMFFIYELLKNEATS